MEIAMSIEEELAACTGEALESIRARMAEGSHRSARLFRSHPGGMEAFYRESEAYLYELANNDEDPFKDLLAARFGACSLVSRSRRLFFMIDEVLAMPSQILRNLPEPEAQWAGRFSNINW